MPYTKAYEDTLYNPKWLRKHYQDRNAAQVAELIGCERSAVLDALRRYKIPVKDAGKAQQLADRKFGSSAPRPRAIFKDTLHNEKWLQEHFVDRRDSKSEMARLAGCSPISVSVALQRFGIEREETEPATGSTGPRKGMGGRPRFIGDMLTEQVMYGRARRACPPGPCVVCGGVGKHVNHIDRNPWNDKLANLERLCAGCHRRQHCEEERVMIEMLEKHGVSYLKVYEMARRRLRKAA